MSYIKCGSCGEKLNVFSKKSAEEQAEYLNIPLIADMPINLDLSEEMEKGEVETFIINNEEYAQLYNNFKNLYK